MSDRPSRYLSAAVYVTPKVAAMLEQLVDMNEIRVTNRGKWPDLDETLLALRYAALDWATSVDGSEPRKSTEATRGLKQNNYTPAQAAERLNVTPHAVRLAIREHRLNATNTAGRWSITAADLELFKEGTRP